MRFQDKNYGAEYVFYDCNSDDNDDDDSGE